MRMLLVKTKTPKRIKRTPEPYETKRSHLVLLLMNRLSPTTKSPEAKKGSIIPIEYIKSRTLPWTVELEFPVMVRMLPRVGPTQGIKPTPIAVPIRKEPTYVN